MRPDSPRALAAQRTQATILMVARDLFVKHGYEDVTIRQVARGAGVSTGAIMKHWPTKDDLFLAAMGRRPVSEALGAAALARLRALA
jgi:AcrR family transcriptional regulator